MYVSNKTCCIFDISQSNFPPSVLSHLLPDLSESNSRNAKDPFSSRYEKYVIQCHPRLSSFTISSVPSTPADSAHHPPTSPLSPLHQHSHSGSWTTRLAPSPDHRRSSDGKYCTVPCCYWYCVLCSMSDTCTRSTSWYNRIYASTEAV